MEAMVRALPPELPPLPEQVVELCAAGGLVTIAMAIGRAVLRCLAAIRWVE